ncbi:MAG: DUF2066 domain-containing protein [Gammaproteobacteria bacterium]|nr:DUF2066 domain-containing protein [Gammaproteobacteria bacterium]
MLLNDFQNRQGAEFIRPPNTNWVNFTASEISEPLLTIVCRLLSALICFASVFGAAPSVVAAVVPWLYEVEVAVDDQTSAAIKDASEDALLDLLTRLTGLVHIPRLQAVASALASPDQYYNQFSYVQVETLDEDGLPVNALRLRIAFEPASVLRLIKKAALPIWRSNRPKVVAWVVVEANGSREIVGAGGDSELAAAIQERARQRGLALVLPLLDLEDQLQVDPAAVWGRLSAVLNSASERYQADIVLVGRVQAQADGWAAGWEFWIDGELKPFAGQSSDLVELGSDGVDFVADELAQRYAVLGRSVRDIRLVVAGIHAPADYGSLLRYLGRLEFVDHVTLTSVQGDRMGLVLTTRAEPEQLLQMFAVDGFLAQIDVGLATGPDIELVWQRR